MAVKKSVLVRKLKKDHEAVLKNIVSKIDDTLNFNYTGSPIVIKIDSCFLEMAVSEEIGEAYPLINTAGYLSRVKQEIVYIYSEAGWVVRYPNPCSDTILEFS